MCEYKNNYKLIINSQIGHIFSDNFKKNNFY